MSDIDWSKAPEGATHYQKGNTGYLKAWIRKNDDGSLDAIIDDGIDNRWGPSGYFEGKKSFLIERPSWNGEGLPPVGTVCEFKSVGHHSEPEYQWCIFRGMMSCGGYIVEYHHNTSHDMVTCAPFDPALTTFRPIRTPEQIAAEEREKAINQMLSDYEYSIVSYTHCLTRTQAARIYDAGYRKAQP